jgi:formyl-CoA transferase
MLAIGRADLADRADVRTNDGRVAHVAEIDTAITEWTRRRSVATVLEVLEASRVPAGRIYTAKDIAEDPQYKARGMIQTVRTREGYDVDIPGIVPKLSATPGAIRSAAPLLGEHTREVLQSCGLDDARLNLLSPMKTS